MRHLDILADWENMQELMFTLKNQWSSFVTTGKAGDNGEIRPEILSSWRRCQERAVNPYNCEPEVLSASEVQRRRRKYKRVLDIAEPLLREAAEGIQDTGLRFDFFDADLYLLDRFGEKNEAAAPPKRKIDIGTSFGEFSYGTNAVCLAKLLEKPIQLMTFEHYCTAHHSFTCTAVPIRDEGGKIIAVISTDLFSWPIHTHTTGMLIALKRTIEHSLVVTCKSNLDDTNLLKEALEVADNPMVVVNAAGVIVAENKAALEVLNRDRNIILGTSCESLWGSRNPFIETIISKKPIKNREVTFDMDSYTLRMTGNVKPIFNSNGKLTLVSGAFRERPQGAASAKSKGGWRAYYSFDNIIGESREILQTIKLARETAKIESNTLIQGESGTGKELFAQAIHNDSDYREGPFVAVNCSAIPFGLLESELFGYEKGAFTGANKDGRVGKFEAARGGTLFLDEINSMPLDMQSKILRALQSKNITRVGGNEEIPINVRIIAATNVDLWDMVKKDQFREDLFYRLNVITIAIPPLRERRGDISLLIENFVRKLANQTQMPLEIDEEASALMQEYAWPGNIRELENVLEKSMVMARTEHSRVITKEILMKYQGIANRWVPEEPEAAAGSNRVVPRQEKRSLIELEKEEIERILQKNDYNVSKTAQELGVVRNTVYNKIKKYGIDILR